MSEYRGKKVFVTGGGGFLGKHLINALKKNGATVITDRGDLTNPTSTDSIFYGRASYADFVFHLAGYNGGIKFNIDFPFDIFTRNTLMAAHVVKACVRNRVKKLVSIVASCAYPKDELVVYESGSELEPRDIMREDEFLNGPIHETVACHGYAKRNLQLATKYAASQYGLDAVCVCPTTLYGPGDIFDPERTKVMGAMVRRFVDATDQQLPSVTCWGSGAAMREFLYVEDAADMILQAGLLYKDPKEPLNLGSGQEYTIKELTLKVAEIAGYKGEILWDTAKSDGQLRKRLDLAKMHNVLGTNLLYHSIDIGIKKTIEYYRQTKHNKEDKQL
jgi:GDP-L-fucose synthase